MIFEYKINNDYLIHCVVQELSNSCKEICMSEIAAKT